jgi:hypothetical protein
VRGEGVRRERGFEQFSGSRNPIKSLLGLVRATGGGAPRSSSPREGGREGGRAGGRRQAAGGRQTGRQRE